MYDMYDIMILIYNKIILLLSDGIVIKLHVPPNTKFPLLTKLYVCVDLVSSYCTQNFLPNEQHLFEKF